MADREVMALLLSTNVQFVADVLREDAQTEGQAMRAIAATRSLDLIVDDILRALVMRARAAGHTWAEIGDILHVTRQAAFQRFGSGAPQAPDSDTSTPPIRGAAKRAVSVVQAFLDGRWDDVRASFDNRMSEAFSAELMADVREKVQRGGGDVREMGTPGVSKREGLTVVDIPVTLERASGTGQVIFDGEGRVAGFFVRPTGPAQ
jgi:hypothetical protein